VPPTPFRKAVSTSAPGLFTADSSGQRQAAMTNSDGSYNTPSNPAAPGSYVTFYLTGEGQTDPAGLDGTIAGSAANVALPVTILIAGRTAQLLYAGSAPGNVNGFAQINVVIPSDIQFGGNLPLVVKIGGVASQTGLTLAVSGPAAPIPGAPQGLSPSINASGQIVLGWTASDGLAARFHIERQNGAGGFTKIAAVTAPANVYTDSGVTMGIAYQYKVRAENDYGFSSYSAVVTATVPGATLAPPSNVQAIPASQTQINLTWSTAKTIAAKFHIERRSGATGAYAEITVVPNTATSYQDTTVQPSTAYTYRMRSEGASGALSAYSSEVSATTPVVPLPPAPTLQATEASASQVHLTWSTTATGIVAFSVERRTTTGAYSQISQPTSNSTSLEDPDLTGSTTYLYRMRVQTNAGLSPYSNEVTVTTLQPLPAAPTNLQAIATSSDQVNLIWTNNAPGATVIRVEYLPPNATAYIDILAASTLTATGVTNLQPKTTYSFRVRAQSAAGYSGYSNVATVTTLSILTTVFLIHGIGQTSTDMQPLYGSLSGSSGIDLSRFRVNAGFDFSDCADKDFCSPSCSISAGAQRLAQYIANAKPPGDIVLIGFSLGGLLARDLMANGRLILNGRRISALITLGTPNLGYPYTLADTLIKCTQLVQQMDGNWRSQQSTNTVVLSAYLLSLTNQWPSSAYPGTGGFWLAASGRSCSNPLRTINTTTGCRDRNPYSDGVVCDDSASYSISTPFNTGPNRYWQDPGQIYVHSNTAWGIGTSFVLCGNSGNKDVNPPLWNPPTFGPLFAAIKGLINGL
jgi:fibronectin type 3 domain-containing protein